MYNIKQNNNTEYHDIMNIQFKIELMCILYLNKNFGIPDKCGVP